MEKHKVTYKTKDGTLKEQKFDDFNEFADTIEELATDMYRTGMNPGLEIETRYGQISRAETVTGGLDTPQFLGE